jgi:hypothetical protein
MKRSRFLTNYIRAHDMRDPKRHWLLSSILWAIGLWAALTPIMVMFFTVRWLIAKIVSFSF